MYQWRLEQEHKLAQKALKDSDGVMSDEEVANFVQHYQRITEHALCHLPEKCDGCFIWCHFRQLNGRSDDENACYRYGRHAEPPYLLFQAAKPALTALRKGHSRCSYQQNLCWNLASQEWLNRPLLLITRYFHPAAFNKNPAVVLDRWLLV